MEFIPVAFRIVIYIIMYQKIAIGIILSLLATTAGSYLYLEFVTKAGFENSWKLMFEEQLQSFVLLVGTIPNILLFYIFNKRHEEYKARGVLLGVIFIALLILYFRIF